MKRLFAFVLVLTMILGTVVIPVGANTTEVSTGSLYAIPNDATQVELDDEAYTVLRNLDDVKAAFPTTSVNMNQNYILAADIDCTGTTFEGKDILIPAGTVLEGNGFGFINVAENNGFLDFLYGDEIVIRNTHFGTKFNPIVVRSDAGGSLGAISYDPFAIIRWENCQFYTGVYCQATGNYGGIFGGNTTGTYTFVDCVIDSTVDAGSAAGDHALIAGRCSGSMATFILDGVDFYGSLMSGNNGATIIGWAAGDVFAENCNNYATVKALITGGFIGRSAVVHATLSFKNCVNYGTIAPNPNAPGTSQVGGFVGSQCHDHAIFENCVNLGSISDGAYTGGFLGTDTKGFTAINCLNAGTITGGLHSTGGFAAEGHPVFEGCINVGRVIGGKCAGNLIGKVRTRAAINNCYGLGSLAEGDTGAISVESATTMAIGSGNKYLGSFEYDSYLGVTKDTDAITQEEALAVLAEKYPEYVFVAESDGSISLNQTHLRAVQNTAAADGKFNVRILGTISSLSQLKVGFQGTVSYTENGTPKTKDITIANSGTTRVHKAISAGANVVSAEDLMGTYIYTLKLENLPATGKITIELAPVSVLAGETDETVIVGTTTTLIYQDGVFSGTDGDAEIGTVITLPTYTDEGSDTPVVLDPDANKEHPYDIPANATVYEIDGVEYQVIRTFADWEKAFAGREVKVILGSGFNKKEYTYYYPETLHLILADTLDGEGKTVAPEAWVLGGGSVIEGNGYSIVNYNGFDVFKIVAAISPEDNETKITDKVVVKNLDFGCEDLGIHGFGSVLSEGPLGIGLICASTSIETEWNNCNLYGELYTLETGVDIGGWFGIAVADLTFVGCSFNGFLAAPGNGAGFIGKISNTESVITLDGCENNADIGVSKYAGGFIASTAKIGTSGQVIIQNSVNTGDAWGGEVVGGFIGSGSAHILIENSKNYGDMRAASRYDTNGAGGFIASLKNDGNGVQRTKIINCENYGTMVGDGNSAGGIIGIVGQSGLKYANPVELEKVANFGTIKSTLHGGGIIGSHHATELTVTEALNAGEVFGMNASGIVGLISQGTDINLEVCANIGTIAQTWAGSVSNIGGMASAMPDDTNTTDKDESGTITIKECYAFGKLVPWEGAYWEGSEATGLLVAIGSIVNEPKDNSYADRSDFEVTQDMLIGIDNDDPYTLEAVADLLAEIYTGYTFTVVEDEIVVAPAQNG